MADNAPVPGGAPQIPPLSAGAGSSRPSALPAPKSVKKGSAGKVVVLLSSVARPPPVAVSQAIIAPAPLSGPPKDTPHRQPVQLRSSPVLPDSGPSGGLLMGPGDDPSGDDLPRWPVFAGLAPGASAPVSPVPETAPLSAKPPPLPAKISAPGQPKASLSSRLEPKRAIPRQIPQIKLNQPSVESGSSKDSIFADIDEPEAAPDGWKQLEPGELTALAGDLQALDVFSVSQRLTPPAEPTPIPTVAKTPPVVPVVPIETKPVMETVKPPVLPNPEPAAKEAPKIATAVPPVLPISIETKPAAETMKPRTLPPPLPKLATPHPVVSAPEVILNRKPVAIKALPIASEMRTKPPALPPPLPPAKPVDRTQAYPLHVAPPMVEGTPGAQEEKRAAPHLPSALAGIVVAKDTPGESGIQKAPAMLTPLPDSPPLPAMATKGLSPVPAVSPVSKVTGPITRREKPAPIILSTTSKIMPGPAPAIVEAKPTPLSVGPSIKVEETKPALRPAVLPNKLLANLKSEAEKKTSANLSAIKPPEIPPPSKAPEAILLKPPIDVTAKPLEITPSVMLPEAILLKPPADVTAKPPEIGLPPETSESTLPKTSVETAPKPAAVVVSPLIQTAKESKSRKIFAYPYSTKIETPITAKTTAPAPAPIPKPVSTDPKPALPLTRAERAKKRRIGGIIGFYVVLALTGAGLYVGGLYFSRETRVEGQVIPPAGMPIANEVWIVSDFRQLSSGIAEDLADERTPLTQEIQERQSHVQRTAADIALREEKIRLIQGQIASTKDEIDAIVKQARAATQQVWDGPGADLDSDYNARLDQLQSTIANRAKSLNLPYQPDDTYHSPEVWANAYRLALYDVPAGVDGAKEHQWLGEQMTQWRDYVKSLDVKKEQLREKAAAIKTAPAGKIADLNSRVEDLQHRIDSTLAEEDPLKAELQQAQADLAQAMNADAGLDDKYYKQLDDLPGENIIKHIPVLPNGRFSWIEDNTSFAEGENEHHYWIFSRATRLDGRQYWSLAHFTISRNSTLGLTLEPGSFISTKAILRPNLSPDEQQ